MVLGSQTANTAKLMCSSKSIYAASTLPGSVYRLTLKWLGWLPFGPFECDGQLAFQQDPDLPFGQGASQGAIGSLVHHPEQVQQIHLHLLLLIVRLFWNIT